MKLSYLFLGVFVFICAAQLASAETDFLGTFAQGANITLPQLCGNCTYNNITSIQYPNSSVALQNLAMTKAGTSYSYILSGLFTQTLGTYIVNGVGDLNGIATVWSYTFTVSGNGQNPASDFMMVFIWGLFIFTSIGLLYSFVMPLAKLATASQTIYDSLLSWSFLILMIIVNYMSDSYLLSTYVNDLTNLFLTISWWTNGILPFIALIWTIFKKSTEKKRPLSVQELTGGRGNYG